MSTPPHGGTIARPDGARVQHTIVRDERSIGDLIKELQNESGKLLRQEVELAKAEVTESARSYARSATSVALGAAFLVAALFGVLWTINMGLTALLEGAVGLETAVWLSPLILSAALAATGWAVLQGGIRRMRAESIVPRQTTETLKEEKQWLKNRHA